MSKATAKLGWVRNLPDGGSRAEAVLSTEQGLLKRLADAEATVRLLKAELEARREEAERFIAAHWTADEIRAAKAATGPAESPDADLIAACRKLGNGGLIGESMTDVLRHKGLATKRGVPRLTSAGVRMAERGL